MMALKWWLLFCSSVAALVLCWHFGFVDDLRRADPTYLGFAAITFYFAAMLYVGWIIRRRWVMHRRLKEWIVELPTILGITGTLIGLIMMFAGSSEGLMDMANTAAVQRAVVAMLAGIATCIWTTLVGVIVSALLGLQMVMLNERH